MEKCTAFYVLLWVFVTVIRASSTGLGEQKPAGFLPEIYNEKAKSVLNLKEDWKLEDTVIVSTLDGALQALDRITGERLWVLNQDQPLVRMSDDGWALEPIGDGTLFYWMGSQLRRLPVSIRELVLHPYAVGDKVITGSYTTDMLEIDIKTGRIVRRFANANNFKETGFKGTTFLIGKTSKILLKCFINH